MTIIDKDALKNIANRNITSILDSLGVRYKQRGHILHSECPCKNHGGDRNNDKAFSWRTDIGHWICWSHHCESSYGGDIFGLISSILGCDFKESIKWVDNYFKNNTPQDNTIDYIGRAKRPTEIHLHKPLDETRLQFLKNKCDYLLNRGFSEKVLNKFQAGYWYRPGTYMHDRAIIPIRDHDNYLVGFTGRTIHDEEWFKERGLEYSKWLHGRYFDRFPKPDDPILTGSILFNLNNAKTFIKPHNRIILVEGPLDGFKLDMCGIYNWVASLSTSFGPTHRSLLVRFGISDLYVAYDNDPRKQPDLPTSSEKAWSRIQNIVGDLFRLHKIDLPVGIDPGIMEESEVRRTFVFASQW